MCADRCLRVPRRRSARELGPGTSIRAGRLMSVVTWGHDDTPGGDEMAPPARSTLTANATTPAPTVESAGQVAAAMRPLIDGLLGREVPLRFEFWERSMLCHDQSVATLRFNSPDSI